MSATHAVRNRVKASLHTLKSLAFLGAQNSIQWAAEIIGQLLCVYFVKKMGFGYGAELRIRVYICSTATLIQEKINIIISGGRILVASTALVT